MPTMAGVNRPTNNRLPVRPKFSGNQYRPGQMPTLWKEGFAPGTRSLGLKDAPVDTVVLTTRPEHSSQTVQTELHWDQGARSWVLPSGDQLPDFNGNPFLYRFSPSGSNQALLDATETQQVDGQTWNVARPSANVQSGSIVYAYPDALLTDQQVADHQGWQHPQDPIRTPEPLPSANSQYGGNYQGLMDIIDKLNRGDTQAVRSMMLTPFTDDQDLGGHHYWTTDAFGLNSIFPTPESFTTLIQSLVKHDVNLYADGAFVNQGRNSPMYQSLLRHGYRSPYWDWFKFDEPGALDKTPKTDWKIPSLYADKKLVMGLLPQINSPSGAPEIDFDHVGIEILNSPKPSATQKVYDPSKPTVIRMFDPGAHGGATSKIYGNSFSVDPKEVLAKFKEVGSTANRFERAAAKPFLEWSTFRLGLPFEDHSGNTWDGKPPALNCNLQNPEVRQYAKDAMTYWTRQVDTSTRFALAEALSQHGLNSGNPDDIEEAIINAGLPARFLQINLTDLTTRQPESIDGSQLLRTILKTVPIQAAHLPKDMSYFKATLTWPKFQEKVLEGQALWRRVVGAIINPFFSDEKKWQPADKKLERALGNLVNKLSAQTREKMSHPEIAELVYSDLGQAVWRQLLSGQMSDHPTAISDGMKKTLGTPGLMTDPATASRYLRKAIGKQADALDTDALAQLIDLRVSGLTHYSAMVANLLTQQMGLGLNWRLDAAKDIGDMDKVKNEPDSSKRAKLFKTEMEFVRTTWQELLAGAREISPDMNVVAELTDIRKLGGKLADDIYKSLLQPGPDGKAVFTSMPNMDAMFSGLMQLVHYPPKPHEYGDPHLSPADFVSGKLLPFSNAFPRTAVQASQNIVSSHDYATAHFSLLRNPLIHDMHNRPDRSLQDDLAEVLDALIEKKGFENDRHMLRTATSMDDDKLTEALTSLKETVTDPAFQSPYFDQSIRDFYSTNQKTLVQHENGLSRPLSTPVDIRAAVIVSLLTTLKNQGTGDEIKQLLRPDVLTVLQPILEKHMATPGEVWAMRAVFTNGLEDLSLGLSEPEKDKLYRAFQQVIDEHGQLDARLPGYLSLARMIDQTVEKALTQPATPIISPARGIALKKSLYTNIMKPVLEKDVRLIAAMVAVPGQPSITVHDLLGQTGGELTNNRYLQNRERVRLDWLNSLPEVAGHFEKARQLLALRQQFPVINQGFFQSPLGPDEQPLLQHDNEGVLVAPWDGGAGPQAGKQIIMLVNMPKQNGEFLADRPLGSGEFYPAISDHLEPMENFKPNLRALGQPEGTAYRNVTTGVIYTLNSEGVLTNDAGNGITLEDYAVLERVSRVSKHPS